MWLISGMNNVYSLVKKTACKTAEERKHSRHPPWTVRIDADNENDDEARHQATGEACAPHLFIYLNVNKLFEIGVITTDTKEVKITSCVGNCFVAFISIFEIFQIGFNPIWFDVLALFEHCLLGMDFRSNSKHTNIACLAFLKEFDTELKAIL